MLIANKLVLISLYKHFDTDELHSIYIGNDETDSGDITYRVARLYEEGKPPSIDMILEYLRTPLELIT